MASDQSGPDAVRPPVVWIVSTGTEILQGHYSDRNAPWISARLLALGLSTARHLAIADDPAALREGLGEAARAADLVFTTGGLGPTEDDLGRQAIAEAWGAPLYEDEAALSQISERFRRRGRPMSASNRRQAQMPRGCTVLPNEWGTAPGFFLPAEASQVRAALVALPGPPREMQPMFEKWVAPLLREHFPLRPSSARIATFRTCNLPESVINDRIKDLFARDPEVSVALLFNLQGVDVRLTLEGDGDRQDNAEKEWRRLIRERLGDENVYGEGSPGIETCVGELLRERGETVATAESCTGGMISARLTDVSGSSGYFTHGFVTYANDAKIGLLGVDAGLIEAHGAVSAPVAEAMAAGARRAAGAAWAVAVTGIAGPEGGTADKPVGLVFFGLAGPGDEVRSIEQIFLGNRDEIRQRATQVALDLLRRSLIGAPLQPRWPQ